MKLQVTKYMAIEFTEPNELLELMSEDEKIEFFQSLSCHESVFKHVSDQIIHGSTYDGYHASTSGVNESPVTAFDCAVREVAKKSSGVARREIEKLERALSHQKRQKEDWIKKYFDLEKELIK